MPKTKNRILVSVTNDLVSDNRVHKVCSTLSQNGYEVQLIGRRLPQSPGLQIREYNTKRIRLFFTKGVGFYAEYNIRLFFVLLFSKCGVLLSNDLDTLPANYLISVVRRKPLVYDSHEFFTEVPELIDRPRVKRFWEFLEKLIVPRISNAYTVCNSIARVYKEKYGVDFKVVRNLPVSHGVDITVNRQENGKVVLYQGALNVGRGLEQAILSMHEITGSKLVLAGDGDIREELEQLVENENLKNKVEFLGRLPLQDMVKITQAADLGLSIEEDLGLNYRYALPNKLFDYIQAGVPVLVSDLPEMSAVVRDYEVGEITTSLEPEFLAAKIMDALFNKTKRDIWKGNLIKAAKELTWENEEKVLLEVFSDLH